jgi:hypothetical protein
MYAMVYTQLDIVYVVRVALPYLVIPGIFHQFTIKKIMCYLKGTSIMGCFTKEDQI